MATLFHRGFFADLVAGNVLGAPDLRGLLTMTNTTCDTDDEALKLSNFTTVDEADGVGYERADITNVVVAWDVANNRYEIDGDDGNFTTAPGTLAACTRALAGILWYRHVDGTAANDVPWFWSDDGGFPKTASGGAATFTINAEGLIQIKQL